MKQFKSWMVSTLAVGCLSLPAAALAQEGACDRSCLSGLADKLLASIVAHDPFLLPRTREYAATENDVPAALGMMTLWRTAAATKYRYYIIDPQSGQVFLISTISEGPSDTLLFGRIRVQNRLVSEIELFTNRSRGDGGFEFDADGPGRLPAEWTAAVPPERRASRSDLLLAGRSIFDSSLSGPEASAACVVMENGQVVAENPNVLKAISASGKPHEKPRPTNPDGSVSVPCGNPPDRPTDKYARTDIIDEERGVVVSMAKVHGTAEPYLATNPTLSAFVPNALLRPYAEMLKQQQASGQNPAVAIRAMPGTGSVAQVIRVYDGKLQGLHLLVHLGALGSHSPWVSE